MCICVGNILLLLSLSHGLDNTTRSSLLYDPELRDHDPELTTSRPGAQDFTTVTSRTLFLVLSSSLFSKCPSAQSINTLCAHSFIACCILNFILNTYSSSLYILHLVHRPVLLGTRGLPRVDIQTTTLKQQSQRNFVDEFGQSRTISNQTPSIKEDRHHNHLTGLPRLK